jgi:hypothetical protein
MPYSRHRGKRPLLLNDTLTCAVFGRDGIAVCLILWLYGYIEVNEVTKLGTRVKPVQPTEIKDKRVAREVIMQIRRKPSAAALKRHKEQDEALVTLLKK